MQFKSRIFATAAVLGMAAAAIFGSTKEMTGIKEESRSLWSDNKETIYFWYSDDTLTNYINSAAVSFGEREGVRVIPVLTSDSEYLEAINKATLQSEQVPDAYLISNDSLEKAYLAGLATEITGAEEFCSEQNFPKAALDAVAYDGKSVAYPMYFETSGLVYNQTYLEIWKEQQEEKETAEAAGMASEENGQAEPDGAEEAETESAGIVSEETESAETAGIAPEETSQTEEIEAAEAEKRQEILEGAVPATMDDILNIADTFDAPEGVEGVMKWDVSDIFYNYWIVGNYMLVGGDAGDSERDTDINNAETIECLSVYQALNQFFSIESDTITYDSVIEDFISGKIIFTIGTTDVLARLEEAKENGEFDFAYGIAPMPRISEKLASRSLSVTNAVAVNGYSEQPELANKFARYLTEECADTLYERTGKMSARKNVNADNADLQVFFTEYADSVSLPKMMETGNFWLQLEILFSKVWNGGDVTELVGELADNMAIQMGQQIMEN